MRFIPSITVLALVLLLGVWWISRPVNTWAQVVEAVQSKPWIHLVGTTPDGEEVEQWFSIKHQISAGRAPGYIVFSDFQAGRSDFYDTATKQLTRSPADANSSDRKSFDAFAALFQSLFRGAEKLDVEKTFGQMPDIGRIEQSRREVKDGDGRWYEYDLTLQPANAKPSTITVRVDAASMLPHTMTMVDGERSVSTKFRFDFPDTGPDDIYALGVPRDAAIVDHTPQSVEGDLKAIVDGVRAAAEGFDDYRAIAVMSRPELPWHVGTPLLIWRKGERTRLEIGSVDPDNPPPSEVPDEQTDRARWWRDRCKHLWYYPIEVSDGKTFISNEFTPPNFDLRTAYDRPTVRSPARWNKTDWKTQSEFRTWPARTAPIVWAYPQNLPAYATYPQYHTVIITDPADAPPGSVLVRARWQSGRIPAANSVSGTEIPPQDNIVEYLVDPGRSFVVLRSSIITSVEENGKTVIQSGTRQFHEDFQQSPKGFWYPGLIRTEQTFQQDGKPVTMHDVTRYYLEFDVEIPDDLFQPRERAGRGFPE